MSIETAFFLLNLKTMLQGMPAFVLKVVSVCTTVTTEHKKKKIEIKAQSGGAETK